MNTTHTIIHGVLLSFLDKEALNRYAVLLVLLEAATRDVL